MLRWRLFFERENSELVLKSDQDSCWTPHFWFFFKPNWGWTPNSLERFVVCRRKTSGGPPIRTRPAEISPLTLESLDTIDSQNGGKCYYCYLCCFAESIWFNFITEESDGVGYALEGSSFPYSFKHRNPLTVFAWETWGKSLLSIWIEFTTKTHLYPPRVNKILRFYINQLQLKHYLSFSIHSQLSIVTKERPRTNIGYEDSIIIAGRVWTGSGSWFLGQAQSRASIPQWKDPLVVHTSN